MCIRDSSGRLVDAIGTPHAYVVMTVFGVLTAAAAAVGYRWIRQSTPESAGPVQPA